MQPSLHTSTALALAGLLTCAPLGFTQKAQLEADINALPANVFYPERQIVELGGWYYFARNTPGLGTELWRTAGPSGPLELIKDISPGPAGSRPDMLTVFQGKLFFVADDGTNGFELWSSDGTSAGTQLVKDLFPGSGHAFEPLFFLRGSFVESGGQLWFGAKASGADMRLWRSDGSASGTVVVPGSTLFASPLQSPRFAPMGSGVLYAGFGGGLYRAANNGVTLLRSFYGTPTGLTDIGGIVYFSAAGTSAEGYELWSSAGTVATTQMVKDIYPGASVAESSYPALFTLLGANLVFSAKDAAHGREVWISDGTALGTQRLSDVNPGVGDSVADGTLSQFASWAGKVYFGADDGLAGSLWSSSGSSAGTGSVLASGVASLELVGDLPMGNVPGPRLFFSATGPNGRELWATDGSPAGSQEIADLEPGAGSSWPRGIVHTGQGGAYFLATVGGVDGLYYSDGTALGTQLVASNAATLLPATGQSAPQGLVEHGGKLYFAAQDGITGNEPWAADEQGVRSLGDWKPGLAGSIHLNDPEFAAPKPLEAIPMGANLYTLVEAAGTMQLLRSDGSLAGTQAIASFPLAGTGLIGFDFKGCSIGARLLFAALTPPNVWSLWASDGTPQGTGQVLTLPSAPQGFQRVGNRAFFFTFASQFPTTPARLWASDGTLQGTRIVRNLAPGESFNLNALGSVNGRLLFAFDTPALGSELWASDGTLQGTLPLADLVVGPGDAQPSQLTRLGEQVYFSAQGDGIGTELWRTDGTPAGTQLVADVLAGPAPSNPQSLLANGELLFFVTQGTKLHTFGPQGLQVLGNVPGIGTPTGMIAGGTRRVFFSSLGSQNQGLELWSSSATPGTIDLFEDYTPGPLYSYPEDMTLAFGRLHMRLTDYVKGEELFQVYLGATSQPVGVGCAASGQLPELNATDPIIGGNMRLWLNSAVANSPAVVFAGLPATPLELGSGCTLYLSLNGLFTLSPAFTDAGGEWNGPNFQVPLLPAFVGQALVAQAVVGPTTTLPLGFDVTNAVRLTFGD